MPHSAQPWKRRFALAADTACLLLLGLALFIEQAGGVRLHIGRVGVTARSGTRAFLLAVVLLMVRHVVVLRPSVADRAVSVLGRLQKLSRSGRRRFAAVAKTAVVALSLRPARASSMVLDWPSKREWLWATLARCLRSHARLRRTLAPR
jgi:hypothetical protein